MVLRAELCHCASYAIHQTTKMYIYIKISCSMITSTKKEDKEDQVLGEHPISHSINYVEVSLIFHFFYYFIFLIQITYDYSVIEIWMFTILSWCRL